MTNIFIFKIHLMFNIMESFMTICILVHSAGKRLVMSSVAKNFFFGDTRKNGDPAPHNTNPAGRTIPRPGEETRIKNIWKNKMW